MTCTDCFVDNKDHTLHLEHITKLLSEQINNIYDISKMVTQQILEGSWQNSILN